MITRFKGKYEFLSNFYPCKVYLDGIEYSSVEHAYQAAKTNVASERHGIKNCKTPGKAKRLGRFATLRPNWDEIKVDIMYGLLKQKFTGLLAFQLVETGNESIIEVNTWHDRIWGFCCCESCMDKPAQNLLGKLLMKIREELIRK